MLVSLSSKDSTEYKASGRFIFYSDRLKARASITTKREANGELEVVVQLPARYWLAYAGFGRLQRFRVHTQIATKGGGKPPRNLSFFCEISAPQQRSCTGRIVLTASEEIASATFDAGESQGFPAVELAKNN